MTRQVMTSQEVCHVWANQSQDSARNSSESVFFDGDTIFSYGRHFPMARHVNGVVLVTSRTYSVTTSKHKSYVWSAINHLWTFTVDNVLADSKPEHRANLAVMRKEYEATLVKASRARTNAPCLLQHAESIRNDANKYSKHFKLTTRIKPADISKLTERARQQKARAERKARALKAKQSALFNEKLSLWRSGALRTNDLPYAYSQPVAMRLVNQGEDIETTRGARFPVNDARRALPLVRWVKRTGQTWKRNGETCRLGYYQLDSISANGDVKAGCHYVKFEEIEHLAALLGE